MNARLKQFLAAENISQAQFADTIKVVRASVSHVLAGRNKPGYDFIRAIMASYPNLSMEWLLLGKGKMYKTASDFDDMSQSPVSYQTGNSQNDEMPQLFDYEETQDCCYEDQASVPSISDAEEIKQTPFVAQVAERQRQAIKVVIFFNDGTYQEM